jgi:hypothetical protein
MALASQELGRVVGIASPDDLFTCRLLAQVVKLALAKAHPVDYAAILADCGIAKALAELVYFPLLIEIADSLSPRYRPNLCEPPWRQSGGFPQLIVLNFSLDLRMPLPAKFPCFRGCLTKSGKIIARQLLSILENYYYSIYNAYNTLFNKLIFN